MGLESNLSNSSNEFFGKLCEKMPWDFTIYEKESFCTIKREFCEYHNSEGDVHFCNKRTYTFLPHPIR